MTRSKYDEQLDEMYELLLKMGEATEQAIAWAERALATQDREMAQAAIANDSQIDELEKAVEGACLRIILRQQPVASDLRRVSTALKMITDLERIGDQAADISEITLLLIGLDYTDHLELIGKMAAAARQMVTNSLDAYVQKDQVLAQAVIAADDQIDAMFDQVKRNLIEMIHGNIDSGGQALDLLMIAKYMERIGDHAVNIANWVIFSLTGIHRNTRII